MADLVFEEFVAKPQVARAVLVGDNNVVAIAKLLGATSYSIERSFNSDNVVVQFFKVDPEDKHRNYSRAIFRIRFGNYLLKLDPSVTNEMYEIHEQYREATPGQISNFIRQKHQGEDVDIAAAPYDH